LVAAVVVAVASCFAIAATGRNLNEHGDESQYAWSAAYFGGRLTALDFSAGTGDQVTDPGFTPISYWTATQPMGTRLIFSAVLGLTRLQAPAAPHFITDAERRDGPDTRTPLESLASLRLAAAACAGAGLGLLAFRWGWRGAAVSFLLLVLHVREDLSRAWAEGPLFFGLCLCAATWRTRWFPFAAGLTTTFKLTALPLWGLVFLFHPIGRSRWPRLVALMAAVSVWVILTPPAWFSGGPLFLVPMLLDRAVEHAGQSEVYGGPLGLFFPTRYLRSVDGAYK
jgi:hypothetical protein